MIAVEKIFFYVHSCRSHDVFWFSHIPKPKTGLCILTLYVYGRWAENHVLNVMNTASDTPNYPGCCGGTCA